MTSRIVFAATLIGLGVLGLITGQFAPIWSGVPRTLPGREIVIYLCALVLLGSGLGLLFRGTAVVAARVLLIYLIAWMALVRLPYVVFHPLSSGYWWAVGESAVLISAAWILYGQHLRFARPLYGLGLIPFGIAHFTFLARTVSMVPGWLPWHPAWAYFTGIALIVAGVAVAVDVYARLAATLSTIELALFTLLVWGPVLVAGPTPSDWSEIIDSWILTIAAWVVAESYRGTPWLGLRRAAGARAETATPAQVV